MKGYFMRNLKKLILNTTALTLFALAIFPTDSYEAHADEETTPYYEARLGIQGTSEDGVEWIQRIGYYSGENMDDDPTVLSTDNKEKGSYEIMDLTAEITGNGTYSVALTFNEDVPISIIKQLQVATNIPYSEDIKFTDFLIFCTHILKLYSRTISRKIIYY